MYIIAGLGNPGLKYKNTRHNVGWAAVDALAEETGAHFNKKRFDSKIAECRIAGQRAVLLKPLTYMNLSGRRRGILQGAAGKYHRYLRRCGFTHRQNTDSRAGKRRHPQRHALRGGGDGKRGNGAHPYRHRQKPSLYGSRRIRPCQAEGAGKGCSAKIRRGCGAGCRPDRRQRNCRSAAEI